MGSVPGHSRPSRTRPKSAVKSLERQWYMSVAVMLRFNVRIHVGEDVLTINAFETTEKFSTAIWLLLILAG